MEITRKVRREHGGYGMGAYRVITGVDYWYAVTYRGHTFVASGTDLGACIGRCYGAANPTSL